jgi:YbbR domain-containing protein
MEQVVNTDDIGLTVTEQCVFQVVQDIEKTLIGRKEVKCKHRHVSKLFQVHVNGDTVCQLDRTDDAAVIVKIIQDDDSWFRSAQTFDIEDHIGISDYVRKHETWIRGRIAEIVYRNL